MIRVLPPEEAKKIAAGEVIDRPAALVRELLDNALDSGASSIELTIEGGGIDKVEVIDNGSGMGRDDLELSVKTHATSKIQSLDDLSRFTTLGFRGEALAAAAAVSRMEIISSLDGREAWLLETLPGESPRLTQTRRTAGTSVRSFGLFDTIPARKRFLKRESSEASLCRQIFIEKALAFPEVLFRFVKDGNLKLQLLPSPDLQSRFGELMASGEERIFLHTAETSGPGFTVHIIFGGPELFCRDRRQQYIFANKRRIQEYGLMQALEYGLSGFFPNGSHPVGAVFVEVDPALADFNIHPAKREVRFADAGAIHHAVTAILREYTGKTVSSPALAVSAAEPGFWAEKNPVHTYKPSPGFTAAEIAAEPEAPYTALSAAEQIQELTFIGRAFDLFIIAERQNRIYLIDQHAAHERILYNHFLSKPIVTQELLVPIPFTTASNEEDRFLKTKQKDLLALGIVLENDGVSWRIEALPAGWKESDSATVKEILALRDAGTNMIEHWAAALSCRRAIKDGEKLDDHAALALAEAALTLADESGTLPRCPHGRPLWTELSREDLFRAVRRTE